MDWLCDGISQFTEFGKGHSHFMKGCVVDMFHFPMFSFNLFGKHFEFFSYIFNVADSAITIGANFSYLFSRGKHFLNGFQNLKIKFFNYINFKKISSSFIFLYKINKS